MPGSPAADLLVVGAGPAGCSTAIRAVQAGLRVILVDRARFPREKPCSEYMSPETVRQLDQLGVLADLDRLGGAPITGTTVTGPGGSRLTGLFARAGGRPFRPFGLALPRRVLDEVLVRQAERQGAILREGTAVTDLLYQDGAVAGAVVRTPAGRQETIRARLTVGADGLRSVVARRLGGRRHGRPARMAFVAHVAGVPGLSDQAEMHVGGDGYVGLGPLGGGIANVALVVPRAAALQARGRSEAFFLERLGTFPGVRGRVDRSRIVRRILVTGPFAAWTRQPVRDGALLVGDAAEFFDPFTGEGICTALRGGAMAAAAAVRALDLPGPVPASRLAPYLAARRQAFAGKWAVERLIGFGMLAPALFDRAIERLERRGWSHTLVGVTGHLVPARAVLNPRFLAGMLW